MTGGTTHKLRPSPYLLQVTSRTLFFPVQNYPPHTFHSERTPESHNLTPQLTVNPNLAEAPDFTLEVYAIACDVIAAQLNITTEAAAECLKTAWTADNEAKKQVWEQQELAD